MVGIIRQYRHSTTALSSAASTYGFALGNFQLGIVGMGLTIQLVAGADRADREAGQVQQAQGLTELIS